MFFITFSFLMVPYFLATPNSSLTWLDLAHWKMPQQRLLTPVTLKSVVSRLPLFLALNLPEMQHTLLLLVLFKMHSLPHTRKNQLLQRSHTLVDNYFSFTAALHTVQRLIDWLATSVFSPWSRPLDLLR